MDGVPAAPYPYGKSPRTELADPIAVVVVKHQTGCCWHQPDDTG
jgi:hypothetical protein